MSENKECSCIACRRACMTRVGWFLPDQISLLALRMNLSVKELFEKYLMIDYWNEETGFDADIFLLAPAIQGYNGKMTPYFPIGTCIFYKNEKCYIHDIGKPFECVAFMHDNNKQDLIKRHKNIALAWKNEQELIKKLLGQIPIQPPMPIESDCIQAFYDDEDPDDFEDEE